MAERHEGNHPDPDRLLDYNQGLLPADEADQIAAHLTDCPVCALELKRLLRFQALANDDEAAAAAEWERADEALRRAYEREIRPAVRASSARKILRFPSERVLIPVAAAALLIFAVMNFNDFDGGPVPGGGDSLRGGQPVVASVIVPDLPQGEIPFSPTVFTWSSEKEFESYLLEVFSPDLDPVFRLSGLRETRAVIPDSLRGLLEPGLTYLWNVQGRSGLAEAEQSLTAWFRTSPAAAAGN